MLVVGLTGGIATGKSTAAAYFEKLGAHRIDTDLLAREVVEPGQPGLAAIVRYFGASILDESGRLNRKKLGTLVFRDKEKRRALEQMLHPLIRARMEAELAAAQKKGERIVLLEVPLLFETNFHKGIDKIIVVAVDTQTQLDRLMRRDGLTKEGAEQRVAAQMPLEEKISRADYIIANSGALTETEAQIQKIWHILLQEHSNV